MIKVENIRVMGLVGAISGMRNPLKSYERSDSTENELGEEDKKLALRLIRAGTDHSKFMRQIFIGCDITAPEYWWKQFHTYKVGTVENSTSQMHMILKRKLTLDDFGLDPIDYADDYFLANFEKNLSMMNELIEDINRETYEDVNFKQFSLYQLKKWRQLIKSIPQSFLYRKYCTLNYAVLRNMYQSRKNHKLNEWHIFLESMLDEIPHSDFITVGGLNNVRD